MTVTANEGAATDTATDTATAGQWQQVASRALHPSARDADEVSLQVIAEGLAQVAVPWELRTGTAPAERRYERVLATAAYDAWVIYWPPGFELPLHDHGGSWGAFSIVGGGLEEVTMVDGQRVSLLLGRGETVHFGPDHVHAVGNPTTLPATSLHVYSPPLSSMAYFGATGDGSLALVSEDPGGWEDRT
jgi:hypothetical protein